MIRALLLGLCLSLGACAARTPLPSDIPALQAALPLSLHIQREQAGLRQDWLLIIQAENAGLRWTLFDPLGVPLARQRLHAGAWHGDGLLPANAEARPLFAALLFALTPAEHLASGYPSGSWQRDADGQRRLNPNWRISYRSPLDFTLNSAPDTTYRANALPSAENF